MPLELRIYSSYRRPKCGLNRPKTSIFVKVRHSFGFIDTSGISD
jgi:hypothetical protein